MLLTITSPLESALQFITALFIFVFVVFITWLTSRYIAGYQKQKMNSSNIEVVEVAKIAPNKYLQIIRAGDKYLLIAIGKDEVTLLSELSKDSLQEVQPGNLAGIDFAKVLEKAKLKTSKDDAKKEGKSE